MKNFILICILLIGAFIWYLKYPIYDSWIEDKYFETNEYAKKLSSNNNWMLTFKKFEKSLQIENLEYFSKKFTCENWKELKRINLKKIPDKCTKFKTYIESNDFNDVLEKKNISIREYEKIIWKQIYIYYLNEKKIIENLENKDFLKYTSSIIRYSNKDYTQAKASYIVDNILTGNNNKWVNILYKSIQNELYIIQNVQLDTITLFIFETRLKIYLNLLEKLITSNKLDSKQKDRFKILFKRNMLKEELLKNSLKVEYWKIINNYNKLVKENQLINTKKDTLYKEIKTKIKVFLFIDFKETRELYKKYFRESIENTKSTYVEPTIPDDIKNYLWKQVSWTIVTDYSYRFRQYDILIERIKKLENNL